MIVVNPPPKPKSDIDPSKPKVVKQAFMVKRGHIRKVCVFFFLHL